MDSAALHSSRILNALANTEKTLIKREIQLITFDDEFLTFRRYRDCKISWGMFCEEGGDGNRTRDLAKAYLRPANHPIEPKSPRRDKNKIKKETKLLSKLCTKNEHRSIKSNLPSSNGD